MTNTTLTFAPTASARAARKQMQRAKLIPDGATITDYNDPITIMTCDDLDLLKRYERAAARDESMARASWNRAKTEKSIKMHQMEHEIAVNIWKTLCDRIGYLTQPPDSGTVWPIAPMPAPTPIRSAQTAPDALAAATLDAEAYARSVAVSVAQKGRNLWASFDAKPDAEVRDRLKAYGFRWAPKRSAWWLDTTRATAPAHAADIAAG